MNEQLSLALNEQMNFEYFSAHVYLAMAAYCAAENLDGFSNFFTVQAEEERFHASKFNKFLNDRNQRITFTGMSDPKNDYSSLLDVFQTAFAHEQEVTRRIYHLSDLALNDREHATMQFLKWFIDEQVEEEATFDSLISKLKRIGDDSSALYALDNELATRVFTPPAL